MSDPRRALPSVSSLLEDPALRALLERGPRGLVVEAARDAVSAARRDPASAPADGEAWASAVESALSHRTRSSLRTVINATGVVLHTNLGRAPLAPAALDAIVATAGGYTNLEYDLERGERGSRYSHCVSLLRELTGAADALVVNNGAAALVLALATLAGGREAIVSRGELVEIGGSFRIPDIMAQSGATLVEVGSTNRTHLDDYRRALRDTVGAIVKVHRSNFTLAGFVAEVEVAALAPLAREFGVPVVHDLGSGLLLSLEPWGLRGEPTVVDALRAGSDVVIMSGDKLLGGPQAGILVGDVTRIAEMRANPLARALRVDKLTLAALEATLMLYRDSERAVREIPTLAMLTVPASALRERAVRMRDTLAAAGVASEVVSSEGSVGGGAFPGAILPSMALAPDGSATELERRCRHGDPPVIGRIANERFLIDLRAVPPADDELLARAMIAAAVASAAS